jgi:hypothetical protein
MRCHCQVVAAGRAGFFYLLTSATVVTLRLRHQVCRHGRPQESERSPRGGRGRKLIMESIVDGLFDQNMSACDIVDENSVPITESIAA